MNGRTVGRIRADRTLPRDDWPRQRPGSPGLCRRSRSELPVDLFNRRLRLRCPKHSDPLAVRRRSLYPGAAGAMLRAMVEILAPAGDPAKLATALHFGAGRRLPGPAPALAAELRRELYARRARVGPRSCPRARPACLRGGQHPAVRRRPRARRGDLAAARGAGARRHHRRRPGRARPFAGARALGADPPPPQASVTNAAAARFWHGQDVRRICVARELSLEQLGELAPAAAPVQIEAFIHGAVCVAWSGRSFSRSTAPGRTAIPARGSCAQACRWPYRLVEDRRRPGEPNLVEADERGTYFFDARDLCALPVLESAARDRGGRAQDRGAHPLGALRRDRGRCLSRRRQPARRRRRRGLRPPPRRLPDRARAADEPRLLDALPRGRIGRAVAGPGGLQPRGLTARARERFRRAGRGRGGRGLARSVAAQPGPCRRPARGALAGDEARGRRGAGGARPGRRAARVRPAAAHGSADHGGALPRGGRGRARAVREGAGANGRGGGAGSRRALRSGRWSRSMVAVAVDAAVGSWIRPGHPG